ncbi:membrane protein [Campylobacter insulaenigrae]|uniref:SPOR domain-containing protein n=1 Tax=Campylobacter insulaenigrae TaxID=260714 RepID=UPI000F6B7C36|nr:SPOR domain-containing protein [Campylobacter insulaenigrae]MCR6591654.1 SPOR domain-containing protein [Campylobacter insulaenigrae]MCR6593144.1 SPOR domain-containing protein [Campylobacter insulaenigrae]VEJ53188.1 membrane protein [Campylobacter insulaenigrae]
MEENKKNEFDDIILQKSGKNEKIKKILLRAIILIIVFLVVMIVMKLINNPSEEKSLQIPSEPEKQSSYESNFDSLPITDNSKEEDEFEALARKLKEESALNENNMSTNEVMSNEIPLEENVTDSVINSNVLDQIASTEPKEEKNMVSNVSNIEELPEKKAKPEVKKEIKDAKVVKENVVNNPNELFEKVKTTDSNFESGAYIQVFSLNTLDPKSKELNILKENGYNYKIYKTTVNGKELTKVLVGPYSENDLKVELEKIRSKVAKGAFTFRIK